MHGQSSKSYYISIGSNVTANVMGPIIVRASITSLLTETTATFNSLLTEERYLRNWSIPTSTRVHLIVINCATLGRDLTDDLANKTVSAAKCNMERIV
jgi:hypothetical protein